MNHIMPFGKYKGQPLEAIIEDKKYVDWICQQAWFREKYCDTYQFIINNFNEPSETPEHNKLQAMFLELDLQLEVIKKTLMQFNNIVEKCIKDIKESCKRRNRLRNDLKHVDEWKRKDVKSDIEFECSYIKAGVDFINKIKKDKFEYNPRISFESDGYDIVLAMRNEYHNHQFDPFRYVWDYSYLSFGIEIKPVISDDYPAILRQIKTAGSCAYRILIYDKFTATGASIAQVKSIFSCSRIYVLSFADILGHEVL